MGYRIDDKGYSCAECGERHEDRESASECAHERQQSTAMFHARGAVKDGLARIGDQEGVALIRDGINQMRAAGAGDEEVEINLRRLGVPRRRDGLYGRT